jgi:hypothetical protein
MNAFKAQQHRWVGFVQVARKPARVWRSDVPFAVKVEAFHLTYNVPYVALFILALIVYPVVLARYEQVSGSRWPIPFSLRGHAARAGSFRVRYASRDAIGGGSSTTCRS